jgi:hypothetical protein
MKDIFENWRKVLREGLTSLEDDIFEFKVKLLIPHAALDDEGVFIGLERLKNDIRSIVDVTVVNTLKSREANIGVIAILIIKINTRLLGVTPEQHIKKTIFPALVELFTQRGGFSHKGRPRILAISGAQDHIETN